MSSLKEIKSRIASVRSTQKITSAMRMVSSAKLHRTQNMTQNFLRYAEELRTAMEKALMTPFVLSGTSPSTGREPSGQHSLPIEGEARGKGVPVILIPISSSSGLCGAFNSNIIKATMQRISEYKAQGVDVRLIPIGKKITKELKKDTTLPLNLDYAALNERVEKGDAFGQIQALTQLLQESYEAGTVGQAELLYHHFVSMGRQQIQTRQLQLAKPVAANIPPEQRTFLTEPSPQELADELHPKLLNAEVYGALLDAITSEHAARMLAMQTADDNANELLHELTLLYNKTRQQAITNELIDIMGGKISQ